MNVVAFSGGVDSSLVAYLETRELGVGHGMNVVAFSGGVDSSLVAYLVRAAFGEDSCAATIGCSPSLPLVQLERARQVARQIGIQLWEVATREGDVEEYVANEGASCYHCKSSLYSTLHSLASLHRQGLTGGTPVVLFNGTNADDLTDLTRLGLLAAQERQVASPLASLPKAAVRAVARAAGLPNWDTAAAPCLRSRLAWGVPATPASLSAVEAAEALVRQLLEIADSENMRVRVLAGGEAVVEVDAAKVLKAQLLEGSMRRQLRALGLRMQQIRAFKSGSLSAESLALS
eukprot:jgi/Mesen1/5075/ME000252S04184